MNFVQIYNTIYQIYRDYSIKLIRTSQKYGNKTEEYWCDLSNELDEQFTIAVYTEDCKDYWIETIMTTYEDYDDANPSIDKTYYHDLEEIQDLFNDLEYFLDRKEAEND